jgi:hypothetical protein
MHSFQDSIDAWDRNNRQPMHCRQKTLTGGDCDGHRRPMYQFQKTVEILPKCLV